MLKMAKFWKIIWPSGHTALYCRSITYVQLLYSSLLSTFRKRGVLWKAVSWIRTRLVLWFMGFLANHCTIFRWSTYVQLLSLSLSATSGNFGATFSFFSSKTAFSVLSLSSPIVDFHVSLFSPSSHYKDDFKLFLFHCLLTIFIVILYSLSLPIGINFTYVPFVAFFYLYSLSRTFFFFH